MAASDYIQPSEYAAYGISSAQAFQVSRASRLIDTYCARAKYGFVYGVDGNGNPAYMTAASPDIVWKSIGGISPGQNIVVPVASGQVVIDIIGKTVTLDAATPSICEVCTIVGVTNSVIANGPTPAIPATITLGNVVFSHPPTGPGVDLVGGLQIFESRYIDTRRAYVRVAQFPVNNILSGAGRIEYGRRSGQITGSYYDNSILAVFSTAQWGGAPPWLIFDVTQGDINPLTGQVWIPVCVYLLSYSEVRLWYTAGYTLANLPAQIKQACANIVTRYLSVAGTPMMDSTFKKMSAGDTSLERFKNVSVDEETANMLDPFRANQYF